MQVSTDKPEGDWLRKRTLHHYPHDLLGRKLGITAFTIMCVVGAVLCMAFLVDNGFSAAWKGPVVLLGLVLVNALGIFSQILTGGRCWHGAVAMAAVWMFLFIYMFIAMS